LSDDGASACRVDVWLWRARFFKTRTLAATFVDEERVRLFRDGRETRLDKASRTVRPGDGLVFALGGRLIAVRVEALGIRRGPASEARTLFSPLDPPDSHSDPSG
jgi:ribosomal 50S subunit-recycling heat shock protein